MGKIIGIDLGTTNSAIAIFEKDQPTIYVNANGDRTTPSVIAFKKGRATTYEKDGTTVKRQGTEDQWIVGKAAKNQAALNPLTTFYGVKRLIGRSFEEDEVAKMQASCPFPIVKGPNGDAWLEVDGKAMAPAQISSMIVRALKESVEKQVGEEVTEAVITVPAFFNDMQRQATKDAGYIAGLKTVHIVNEPTAAALAYGMDKKSNGKVAVYDLGGGTFDVSILEYTVIEGEGFLAKVLATKGDTFLGGENFDEALTGYIIKKIKEEFDTDFDPEDEESRQRYAVSLGKIRQEAERVKIELSNNTVSTINLPFILGDVDQKSAVMFEEPITRQQLENLLRPMIDKTVDPCKAALAEAGLKMSDIDEVILVGGQTRMPLVVDTVRQFFGKEPLRNVNPDEIVAMGASVRGAIVGGSIDNAALVDVIPLSIGLRLVNGEMDVVVPKNTVVPCEITHTYATSKNNQRDVRIRLFQGERPIAEDNRPLGEFILDNLPPGSAGTVEIAVTFNIDENGILEVIAKNAKTGREQKVTIKASGGLSEEEVKRMLKDAEANKERDTRAKELLYAVANAAEELENAKLDQEQEYFTTAPEDLKTEFLQVVEELTKAHKANNGEAMLDLTKKFQSVRQRIGDAFNGASAPTGTEETVEAPAADVSEETPAAPAAEPKPKSPGL